MDGLTIERRRARVRGLTLMLAVVASFVALTGGGIGGGAAVAATPCTAPPWVSTATYDQGAQVTHRGHQWRANSWLWPGVEPGVSGAPPWWVPWQDLGACSSTTTSSPPTTSPTTTQPGGSGVEARYTALGPWTVTTATAPAAGTPGVTLTYPANLGAGGYRHPIVTWANGAGGSCSIFADTFQHLASWGFAIVCPNTGEIVDDQIEAAGDWMVAQNANSASVFFQKLATDRVAAMGHSRGAGNSNIAAADRPDLFTTLVSLNFTDPWTHPDTRGVDALRTLDHTPVFLAAGTADGLVSQGSQQNYFNLVPGAAARAAVVGAGHNTIQQADNPFQPYVTAWLKYILEGDQFARRAFVGSPPEINADSGWAWQQEKNLP
jgi:pimeloyl-ACP methyl ester carboxylesterase